MKKIIASIFVLTLMGATAADAGVGVQVGGVGIHVSTDHHRHRAPHCVTRAWRHHHREHYCVRWSR